MQSINFAISLLPFYSFLISHFPLTFGFWPEILCFNWISISVHIWM
jgi:hypothetical protein